MLVADVDDVGVFAYKGGIVINQEFLIRIRGRNFLQYFGHLIRTDDDQVIFAGFGNFVEGFRPFGLVCVCTAHLDGLVGDSSGILKGFQAGFGGVKKGLVAEVAVDEADDVVDLCFGCGRFRRCGIRRRCIRCRGFRCGCLSCSCRGSRRLACHSAEDDQHGQQDRYQFLHFLIFLSSSVDRFVNADMRYLNHELANPRNQFKWYQMESQHQISFMQLILL